MKKEEEGRQDFKDAVAKKNEPTKKTNEKGLKWEKPAIEDVSGQVMAQPYIRFT